MPDTSTHPSPPPAPPGWHPALPAVVPAPTVWPSALALAVALCLWGLISSQIITAIGVALFIISLAGWIGDIRHERRTSH